MTLGYREELLCGAESRQYFEQEKNRRTPSFADHKGEFPGYFQRGQRGNRATCERTHEGVGGMRRGKRKRRKGGGGATSRVAQISEHKWIIVRGTVIVRACYYSMVVASRMVGWVYLPYTAPSQLAGQDISLKLQCSFLTLQIEEIIALCSSLGMKWLRPTLHHWKGSSYITTRIFSVLRITVVTCKPRYTLPSTCHR